METNKKKSEIVVVSMEWKIMGRNFYPVLEIEMENGI